MEPILKLEHIQKYYGNGGNVTKAIQDISFSVSEGEFLGIMGASGSGKTTLLNCISTIDTVSAGHIYLEGTDVTELRPKSLARFRRENLGFVFQDFNLLDTLTISENTIIGQCVGGSRYDRAKDYLKCALGYGCGLLVILSVLVVGFSRRLSVLFVRSEDVATIVGTYFLIVSIGYVLNTVTNCYLGALNGIGKPSKSMFLMIFYYIAVRIPLAYLLS